MEREAIFFIQIKLKSFSLEKENSLYLNNDFNAKVSLDCTYHDGMTCLHLDKKNSHYLSSGMPAPYVCIYNSFFDNTPGWRHTLPAFLGNVFLI